jgi:hypothetical protein
MRAHLLPSEENAVLAASVLVKMRMRWQGLAFATSATWEWWKKERYALKQRRSDSFDLGGERG